MWAEGIPPAGNETQMSQASTALSESIDALRSWDPRIAAGEFLGVVLGSGLGGLVEKLEDCRELPYAQIPGFVLPSVVGHAGSLCVGSLGGLTLVALRGRVHLYEGYTAVEAVHAVRVLAGAGAEAVLLTNSGGGITPSLQVGDLMAITDHINLTGRNPLHGPNRDQLGPRFPDLTRTWDPSITAALLRAGSKVGVELKQGVYIGVLGPSYETPAEIRMMATMGADVVGMSTVIEAIALRHMGTRVAGVSLISNAAAGMGGEAQVLSHEEVGIAGRGATAGFVKVLQALAEDRHSWWGEE